MKFGHKYPKGTLFFGNTIREPPWLEAWEIPWAIMALFLIVWFANLIVRTFLK